MNMHMQMCTYIVYYALYMYAFYASRSCSQPQRLLSIIPSRVGIVGYMEDECTFYLMYTVTSEGVWCVHAQCSTLHAITYCRRTDPSP